LSELSPCIINSLFLDERGKVKCFVILVRLGTRIAEETLLIQLLRELESQQQLMSRLLSTHIQYSLRSHVQ
jgi:hypothetical protein